MHWQSERPPWCWTDSHGWRELQSSLWGTVKYILPLLQLLWISVGVWRATMRYFRKVQDWCHMRCISILNSKVVIFLFNKDQTVNQYIHKEILRRSPRLMWKMRGELWWDNLWLLHDNTSAYNAFGILRRLLAKMNITMNGASSLLTQLGYVWLLLCFFPLFLSWRKPSMRPI